MHSKYESKPSSRRALTTCAVVLLVATAWTTASRAQPATGSAAPPGAVLLSTAGAKRDRDVLDSVIHAAVGQLDVVQIIALPGMDLPATQLALDCVPNTPSCLRAVTTQSGGQVLIAPSVQRTSSELMLNIMRFDARTDRLRRVVRRQRGHVLSPETLDAVPAMLRELFDVPEPEPAKPEAPAPEPMPSVEPPPATTPITYEPPIESRAVPLAPILVGAAGLLTIGAGAITGVLKNDAQNAYEDAASDADTEDEVDAAYEKGSDARRLADVTNVLFAVGGAVALAGGIWLGVAMSQSPEADYASDTALSPVLGPNQIGLVLTHRGGSL